MQAAPYSQHRLRFPPCAPTIEPVATTNLLRGCLGKFDSDTQVDILCPSTLVIAPPVPAALFFFTLVCGFEVHKQQQQR
jgi:hypothetical protein